MDKANKETETLRQPLHGEERKNRYRMREREKEKGDTERGVCFARSSQEGEAKGSGAGGGGIVTRELKVLLRSSLSPSNLHWS